MGYQLGVDLGTTYTAAALSRADASGTVTTEVFPLGARSLSAPSMLYLGPDTGSDAGPDAGPVTAADPVMVGEAAQRRALSDPDRVVREFKRRIGDQTPIMIGDEPHTAESLAARLVRWVVDRVAEREGEPPTHVTVTHPAGWGAHKRQLLAEALTGALAELHLPPVTFLTEPQAAAAHYASAERIEPGAAIAVYDLGGGTFDAAVVRTTSSGGFELLGQPQGIDRLGGIDFDEAVFEHVLAGVANGAGQPPVLDDQHPLAMSAVSRLRRECVEAKEALSADTEATIPVLLPGVQAQVRLVRAELESMIRPALEETVDVLRLAVTAAGLTDEDLSAVLLVGGSSRIPLVAQLVSDELGRPVFVDADPKAVVALGAALSAVPSASPVVRAPAPDPEPATPQLARESVPTAAPSLPPPRPTAADLPVTELETRTRSRRRRLVPLSLATVASMVIVIAVAGAVADVPGVPTIEAAVAEEKPPSPKAGNPSGGSGGGTSGGGHARSTTSPTSSSSSPTAAAAAAAARTSDPTAQPASAAGTTTPTTSTQMGTTPPTTPPPSDPPPSDPPPSDPPPSDPPPSDPPPSEPAPQESPATELAA
jgi:molecular chaperone DnaK